MVIAQHIKALENIKVGFNPTHIGWAIERYQDDLKKSLKWGAGQDTLNCEIASIHQFFHIDSASQNHAFAVAPLGWGFDLTEPNCTKAIVSLLNANGCSATKKWRFKTFLMALGVPNVNIPSSNKYLTIEAEHPTGEGRIDIYAEWDSGFLVVEAKIGSCLEKDQLKKYSVYIANKTENSDTNKTCYYIMLVNNLNDGDKLQIKGEKEGNGGSVIWHIRYWFDFLRAWEKHLKLGTEDTNFQTMRRTLWESIL